ncbi:MAG: c-type cytochrome [Phycisphaerales bacterium]|nr:MAG: c-type cytochrome [Phycisphaerales bacterium]
MRHVAMTEVLLKVVLFSCIGSAVYAGPGVDEKYLSPWEVVADSEGKTLYIAEAGARQVRVMDVQARSDSRRSVGFKKVIPVPAQPSGLAVAPDDSTLYVTGASPDGHVFVVNLKTGRITGRFRTGHTPGAPVVSPEGKRLYVCNQFNNDVSVIEAASGRVLARIAVPREPVAAAITADGRTLFVANHLPAGATDGDYAAAEVSVIETASNNVVNSIKLPNGSASLHGIAIAPDGQYAYVTHILARHQLPTTQLERGWMNTNALTIIDVPNKKFVNTVLLDDVDLGAANPWGVTCSADGKYILVTTAGTHELSIIDRAGLHHKIARAARGEKVSDAASSADEVPNDLSFLVGLRRRVKLGGNGPRGLTVIGTKAFIAEYFTDSLGVVDIDPDARPGAESIRLGPAVPVTAVRKGEMYFHDAALCFQKWQSCASCHPGSARTHALNWDLMNDGLGNPKNTKSLLLAHRTPPAMSLGVRADAETAVRAGIKFIQFAIRPEEDAVAIDEYLKSLRPIPSPFLVRGKLTKRAEAGRKLFSSAGCASCHTGELYTDMKTYNVGTGKGLDEDQSFDTPTLIELWRTAPYLHDGRAETIVDVLKKHNPNDAHGRTSDLADGEIAAIAEFVLSL